MNYISRVEEFHKTFNQPILDKPEIPAQERTSLRISMLKEELSELEDALSNNDIVSVLDALCDIQYVLSGTVLEFGLKEEFNIAFDEVHNSNMTKSCETRLEAERAQAHINAFSDVCRIEESNGRYLILRNKDNKVLKPLSYRPPQLDEVFDLIQSTTESERLIAQAAGLSEEIRKNGGATFMVISNKKQNKFGCIMQGDPREVQGTLSAIMRQNAEVKEFIKTSILNSNIITKRNG